MTFKNNQLLKLLYVVLLWLPGQIQSTSSTPQTPTTSASLQGNHFYREHL